MHPCGSLEVCQIPKSHNALIDLFKFISYVQINTRITIKFEVSLHFQSIWPTVRRCQAASSILPKIEWAIAPHPPTYPPLTPLGKINTDMYLGFHKYFWSAFSKALFKKKTKKEFQSTRWACEKKWGPSYHLISATT